MAPYFWKMHSRKKEKVERLAISGQQVGTLSSGAAETQLSQISNGSNQGANARSQNPSPSARRFDNANDGGQLPSKRKFVDENTGRSSGNVSLRIHEHAEGSSSNPIHLDSENNISGNLTISNHLSNGRNNTRNVRSRLSSSGRPAAHVTPPQSIKSVGFSRGAGSRSSNPSNGIPIREGFAQLSEALRRMSEERLECQVRAQQLAQLPGHANISVHGARGNAQTDVHVPVHALESETNAGDNTPFGRTWGSGYPFYSGLSTAEILQSSAVIDGRIVCPFVVSSPSPPLTSDAPRPMPVSGINSHGSNHVSRNNPHSLPISAAGPSRHPIPVSVPLAALSCPLVPVSAVHGHVSQLVNRFDNETSEETWPLPMTVPASSVQINPVSGINGQGSTRRRGAVSRQRGGRGRGTCNTLQSPAAPRNSQIMSADIGVLDYSSEMDFETEDDELSDMRLDVDNMSYEELLELEEQIGNVNIGLTEKAVKKRLKMRKFVPRKKETEPCCICQDEYKKGDMLGSLKSCGHTFHPDCIKQWLVVKDSCPICKTATSGTSK